jgi:hypothetical protein
MEMHSEILKPMAVLAAWTMFMWLWMYATRIPAMSKAGVDTGSLTGGTGKDLDGVIPANIQWKAHNYNHLHEAPTVFYAVALALAFMGAGDGFNAQLAWAYVGLRVVHSLIQSLINVILWRFAVFMVASSVLVLLAVRAAMAAFQV